MLSFNGKLYLNVTSIVGHFFQQVKYVFFYSNQSLQKNSYKKEQADHS